MSDIKDIKYPDVLILINDNPISGCIDYDVSSDLDLFPVRHFGEQRAYGYLKNAEQTHRFNSTWYFSTQSVERFFRSGAGTNLFYSTGSQVITIQDPVEEQLLSGAYVTDVNFNFTVNEIPTFDMSFDCDTLSLTSNNLTSKGIDSRSGDMIFFRSQDAELTSISLQPLANYGSECIQSVNVSITTPKTAVTQLGSRIPKHRINREDATVTVDVSVLKDRIKNMDVDFLQSINNQTGQIQIDLNDIDATSIYIKDLSIKNIQDSLDLNGRDTIEYSYQGLFNHNTFYID